MHFTLAIAALISAVVASPLEVRHTATSNPNHGGGGGSSQDGNNVASGKCSSAGNNVQVNQVCCQKGGDTLDVLGNILSNCAVNIHQCENANQYCCESPSSGGLINLALLNCVSI